MPIGLISPKAASGQFRSGRNTELNLLIMRVAAALCHEYESLPVRSAPLAPLRGRLFFVFHWRAYWADRFARSLAQ